MINIRLADYHSVIVKKAIIKKRMISLHDIGVQSIYGDTGEIKIRYFLDTVCFDNLNPSSENKLPEEQKSLASYH